MEKSIGILEQIKISFDCGGQDIRGYSPLALAYMGDAIYDLVIRTVVVERANRSANNLHKQVIRYVNARTQAQMITALMEELDEEEEAVFRRGRNAKPHSTAKNATAGEYRKATGFEALMGYLYLCDRTERLLYLVKRGIELIDMSL